MKGIHGKNVLVIGATGFIGKNLTEELVRREAKVGVLIRNEKDRLLFLDLKVQYFLGDLLDYRSLLPATRNVDVVFNASGALPHHHLSRRGYWEINVVGVKNLMRAALKNRVKKVVHLSTVGIYGESANKVDEKTLPSPKGDYAESKLAGEKVVSRYHGSGLSTIIIRPTIAYGPGDTRPVLLSLSRLIKKGFFVPLGNGRNFFHTVYVGNLVEAIILSAVKEKAEGESFIIGDDPCPTIGEVWAQIAEILGKSLPGIYIPRWVAYILSKPFALVSVFHISWPVTAQRVEFMTTNKRYETAKVKKILGYKPHVGLKEGLETTLQWYENHNLL